MIERSFDTPKKAVITLAPPPLSPYNRSQDYHSFYDDKPLAETSPLDAGTTDLLYSGTKSAPTVESDETQEYVQTISTNADTDIKGASFLYNAKRQIEKDSVDVEDDWLYTFIMGSVSLFLPPVVSYWLEAFYFPGRNIEFADNLTAFSYIVLFITLVISLAKLLPGERILFSKYYTTNVSWYDNGKWSFILIASVYSILFTIGSVHPKIMYGLLPAASQVLNALSIIVNLYFVYHKFPILKLMTSLDNMSSVKENYWNNWLLGASKYQYVFGLEIKILLSERIGSILLFTFSLLICFNSVRVHGSLTPYEFSIALLISLFATYACCSEKMRVKQFVYRKSRLGFIWTWTSLFAKPVFGTAALYLYTYSTRRDSWADIDIVLQTLVPTAIAMLFLLMHHVLSNHQIRIVSMYKQMEKSDSITSFYSEQHPYGNRNEADLLMFAYIAVWSLIAFFNTGSLVTLVYLIGYVANRFVSAIQEEMDWSANNPVSYNLYTTHYPYRYVSYMM